MANKSDKLRTFLDVLGGAEFYPDLPRVDFSELIDRPIIVQEAMVIEDFTSKFGTHDCMLIRLELDGQPFTTITSGQVVMKRIVKAQREGLLPLQGTFVKGDKDYYNIL
ncbi:hypothetical protein LCGC14_1372220 [marine sediment metagenome]|uniref:Uncharacterized protein n=1 Tax=marine sediment metagenome TaxID=412755 RepID=A0A0F9MKD7_9ZZZZ